MQPFIAGNNGPGIGGPDHLQSDQSQLSYSFDFRDSHFILLNTDPFGAIGTVPINWIHQDLMAAASVPSLKHTFVMGHKQAFTPEDASSEQALDSNPDLRNQFWDELNNAGSVTTWSRMRTSGISAGRSRRSHCYITPCK